MYSNQAAATKCFEPPWAHTSIQDAHYTEQVLPNGHTQTDTCAHESERNYAAPKEEDEQQADDDMGVRMTKVLRRFGRSPTPTPVCVRFLVCGKHAIVENNKNINEGPNKTVTVTLDGADGDDNATAETTESPSHEHTSTCWIQCAPPSHNARRDGRLSVPSLSKNVVATRLCRSSKDMQSLRRTLRRMSMSSGEDPRMIHISRNNHFEQSDVDRVPLGATVWIHRKRRLNGYDQEALRKRFVLNVEAGRDECAFVLHTFDLYRCVERDGQSIDINHVVCVDDES